MTVTREQLERIASQTCRYSRDACDATCYTEPCEHSLARHALSLREQQDALILGNAAAAAEDAARIRALEEEVATLRRATKRDVAHLSSKLHIAKRRVSQEQRRASALQSRLTRCEAALEDIVNYSGGADSALEDEYVMERAVAALSPGASSSEMSRGAAWDHAQRIALAALWHARDHMRDGQLDDPGQVHIATVAVADEVSS